MPCWRRQLRRLLPLAPPPPTQRVPLEGLLRTVATPAPRYMLSARGSAACGGLPPLPFFHLHPCFATSLRMAQQSGGLQRVVAGMQAVPLPPSPPSAGRAAEAAAQHGCGGSGARGMGYWLEVESIAQELRVAQDPEGGAASGGGPASSKLEAHKARVVGLMESAAARQQGQRPKKKRRRRGQRQQQQ